MIEKELKIKIERNSALDATHEELADTLEKLLFTLFDGEEPQYALVAIPQNPPADGRLEVMLASNIRRNTVPDFLDTISDLLAFEHRVEMAQAMRESEEETHQ